MRNPEDAYTIATRAMKYGLSSTVGIIHDGRGQLQALPENVREVFFRVRRLQKKSYARLNHFQEAIAMGRPNSWRCRAGARYLYICEDGLVHYCSQQRGHPGVPLGEYTLDDMRREYLTEKACAPNCTISCVHQTSLMDFWRDPQTIPAPHFEKPEPLIQIQTAGH